MHRYAAAKSGKRISHVEVQGSLEELLAGAADADSAADAGYKGTAVIMSMRFHFATTFAKLREWPAEIGKVLEASARGAAERMRSERMSEDAEASMMRVRESMHVLVS